MRENEYLPSLMPRVRARSSRSRVASRLDVARSSCANDRREIAATARRQTRRRQDATRVDAAARREGRREGRRGAARRDGAATRRRDATRRARERRRRAAVRFCVGTVERCDGTARRDGDRATGMMSHTRTLIFSPTPVDRRWTREDTNAHDVIFALTRLEARRTRTRTRTRTRARLFREKGKACGTGSSIEGG